MERAGDFLIGCLVLVATVALVGFVVVRCIKQSENPGLLVAKWVVSLVAIFVGLSYIAGLEGTSRILIPSLGGVIGVVLAIIWTKDIAELISRPFEILHTGGSEPPELAPVYSSAEMKRGRGLFEQAIADIRVQLEQFPGDFVGTLLWASILAENLKDLPAATNLVEQWLELPERPPKQVSAALNTLADWRLRFACDSEGARSALQRIADLLPDTQWSQMACQRMARLPTREHLEQLREHAPIKLPVCKRSIGLEQVQAEPHAQEDPAALAHAYVKQLQQHPLDTETREKLAMLYADKFQRPDLAIDQLEQLIGQPAETSKRIVRWLNLLATVQLQYAKDLPAAERTLRRIGELFPKTAAAEMAMSRLVQLESELKKQETQVKHLGSYQKNLGLKQE